MVNTHAYVLACVSLLAACGSDGLTFGPHGLSVTASLSAVSLAEDCPASKSSSAGDCGPDGSCPSFCDQSTMQINLSALSGTSAVPFAISEVRVYRSNEDDALFTLSARSPKRWTSTGYVAWEEAIAPSSSIKASYDLSAPGWTTDARFAAGGETYRVEVDVEIDGVRRTLALDGVTRAPLVST